LGHERIVFIRQFVELGLDGRPPIRPVVAQHHVKGFNEALGLVTAILHMLSHLGDQHLRFVDLALQFQDAAVAVLDFVLKIGDAGFVVAHTVSIYSGFRRTMKTAKDAAFCD
jgi:hypothetical protein